MNPKLEKILLFLAILTDVHRTVLSFDSKCPSLKLVNGRIRYRMRGRSVRFNCMKSFQLVGEKYATCMNGDWDTNVPICVKYGCRAPSSTHINGQFIESYRGAVVKIVCNPGYTLVGSPSVYCNGYRWNETFPVCRVMNSKPALSCDFESEDLCGWSQDPMHDFDWKRQNGSVPSGGNGTGPMFDHTRGKNDTGYYMYVESPTPRVENDTARLFSPVYPAEYSNRTCFKFWYHMHGPTTGVLKVYVKPEGIEFFDLIPSFWITGEQGSSWTIGFFNIDSLESPFQIVIEGVRGPGAGGDTAFDDVLLTSGDECRALEEMTSSTEFSTSGNPSDDAIDPFSCQNRCNETKPSGRMEYDTCFCYETCDRDGTCCLNYFDLCSIYPSSPSSSSSSSTTTTTTTTTTLQQTETYATETSSSKIPPTTSPKPSPTSPKIKNPVPQPSLKDFNKESNEVNPSKPSLTNPIDNKPNRTLNEIPRYESTTIRTTSKTTPKPQPKTKMASSVNATVQIPKVVEKMVPGLKVPKMPEMNLTPNEIPRREVQPKGKEAEVVENPSVTSSPVTSVTRISKNPKPNNIELTFLDKPSAPVQPNKSWFHKGKPKESGKDIPQAIKIDKKEEHNGQTLRGITEIGGTSLVLLVIVVLGIIWYRRRENQKSERENMVEDSHSFVYDLDSSTLGSESHSLVGIRPGALQPSAHLNLFK